MERAEAVGPRTSQSRRARRAMWSAAAASILALVCGTTAPVMAGTLPGGGSFVAGTGTISSTGTQLTVNQSSSRGVINWNSFSIDNGARVTFNNGNGATLNRVTGGSPSAIYGTLSATGSVYLINPQGILIGSTGVVSTGGRFVASTLDADTTAFMNGGPLTLSGTSSAQVVNLGTIGSSGGDVFLVARNAVENFGVVQAGTGTVELAAGRQVLLQDSTGSRQVFVQAGSRGTVLNRGVLEAAQISMQASDGNVYALAGNHEALRATGTGTRDGHIWLLAERGGVMIAKTIEAKNADGQGGTVDMNAAALTGPLASCHCEPTVLAGLWNITTPALQINQGAAGAFSRSLDAGTSVNVRTTGAYGRGGDIVVASNIDWRGSASLSLNAYRSVAVNAGTTIRNTGSGNLTLRADAGAIDNGGGVTNGGTIDWSASTGIVRMYRDMNGAYAPGTLLGNGAWAASPEAGIVTQISAYKLVNSAADLQNVSLDLAGNYALGRDIDLAGTQITPIGSNGTPFSGQFDGLGHVIDGAFFATDSQGPPLGLFDVIGSQGVVRNLGVTNAGANISGCWFGPPCYGGLLAGENDGLIARSYSTGYFDGNADGYAVLGGLVGRNVGTIAQSYSGATVSNAGTLGGLVGENDGTLSHTYATGAASGDGHATAGGLVGINGGSITQSFSTALAWGGWDTGIYAGGIVGMGNGGHVSNDVYWNVETTRASNGGDGVPPGNGLTSVQMRDPSNFVGWGFGAGAVWSMPAGADHPVFSWQTSGT